MQLRISEKATKIWRNHPEFFWCQVTYKKRTICQILGAFSEYMNFTYTHSHGCVMCMYLVGLYSVSLLISKCKFLAKQSGLHSSKPDCVARKVTVCAALLSCSSASCACFLTNYCFLARPTMTTKSHWSTYWDNNLFYCLYSKIDQILVFCYQSWSDLLWEKIVLVIENFSLEFAKFLRQLEQFIQTVKGQNNFW